MKRSLLLTVVGFLLTLTFLACNKNPTEWIGDECMFIGDESLEPSIRMIAQPDCDIPRQESFSVAIAQVSNVCTKQVQVAFYDSSLGHMVVHNDVGITVSVDYIGCAGQIAACGTRCFAILIDTNSKNTAIAPYYLKWEDANDLVEKTKWVLATTVPKT